MAENMFVTKLMDETKETKYTLPQFCRTEITSDSNYDRWRNQWAKHLCIFSIPGLQFCHCRSFHISWKVRGNQQRESNEKFTTAEKELYYTPWHNRWRIWAICSCSLKSVNTILDWSHFRAVYQFHLLCSYQHWWVPLLHVQMQHIQMVELGQGGIGG